MIETSKCWATIDFAMGRNRRVADDQAHGHNGRRCFSSASRIPGTARMECDAGCWLLGAKRPLRAPNGFEHPGAGFAAVAPSKRTAFLGLGTSAARYFLEAELLKACPPGFCAHVAHGQNA
jgi:hypothetical protein